MTERKCGNCRWFVGEDLCFRYPKENATGPNSFCGEWADATITPEQEVLQELTRRFAVAIMSAGWAVNYHDGQVWAIAAGLAAAEPQIKRENEQ
jgi:hypothetical protein